MDPTAKRILSVAVLALVYGAGVCVVISQDEADGLALLFRPMNALAIGALVLMGRSRAWPEIATLGVMNGLCHWNADEGSAGAFLAALSTVAHIGFAGWLLAVLGLGADTAPRAKAVIALFAVAVIAPLPGAAIAAFGPDAGLLGSFKRWLLQSVSLLVLLPPFLFWRNREHRRAAIDARSRTPGAASKELRVLEVALAAGALTAAGVSVPLTGQLVLIELSATVLLWFALRFGLFATALTAAIYSTSVVVAALLGFWPGAFDAPHADIMLPLQATLALTTLPALLVAAIMSQREHVRRALHADASRLSYALEGANDGLWDWHVPTGVSFFSVRAARMFGYEPEEFGPEISGWAALVHAEDAPAVRAAFDAHMRGETAFFEAEMRCRHKDGRWVWVLDRGKVVERDADGRAVRAVGTYTDISERKRLEGALEHLATHDALTGLANRAVFERGLVRAAARLDRQGGRVGVILIDVDHFKSVNDTHGHAAGDALLATVAERLRETVRVDDLPARLGGDEFAIIASGATAGEFDALAGRLCDALSAAVMHDGVTLYPTVSIGVAVASSSDKVGEELVARADRALYAAKGAGRGTWRFFGGAGRVA